MGGILTRAELMALYGAALFFLGVFLSQKVKDWIRGVPSDLRKAMKNTEAAVLAKMKAEASKIIDDVRNAVDKPPPAPTAGS